MDLFFEYFKICWECWKRWLLRDGCCRKGGKRREKAHFALKTDYYFCFEFFTLYWSIRVWLAMSICYPSCLIISKTNCTLIFVEDKSVNFIIVWPDYNFHIDFFLTGKVILVGQKCYSYAIVAMRFYQHNSGKKLDWSWLQAKIKTNFVEKKTNFFGNNGKLLWFLQRNGSTSGLSSKSRIFLVSNIKWQHFLTFCPISIPSSFK